MSDLHSGTLTANTVATITVVAYSSQITVVSRSKTLDDLWFSTNGVDPIPNVDGSNWTNGVAVVAPPVYSSTTTVKLLCSSAIGYCVKGL